MDATTILFYILAAITGACAIAVVVSQNIVRAAVWLLFTLCGTAGVYFLLGAYFVGATQLLVYVGGTLVLVVFGVMLTAQGPFVNMRIGAAEWAIATAVGLGFFGVLAISVMNVKAPRPVHPSEEGDGRRSSSRARGRAWRCWGSMRPRPRRPSPAFRTVSSRRRASASRTCCRLKSCRFTSWSC